jgi:membrane protease YdiL (CAAX protease family)
VQVAQVFLLLVLSRSLRLSIPEINGSLWSIAAGHGSILLSALFVGWACGALLEELPFRSLGCLPQRGWLKDFAIGSGIGAASLLLAAIIAASARSINFRFDPAGAGAIGQTLGVSIFIFVFAAAAEEMLFRGYPLQTLVRANYSWVGVLLTSVGFAAVHLGNPNAVPRLTFLNTLLAGVLLAISYVRSGSLWFPIGWHWAWNWMQGSVAGLPVSGIERITPAPLLKAFNVGPNWLTGGAYGIEGGAACTMALIISTLVIWRVNIFSHANAATADGASTDSSLEKTD